MSLRRFVLRQNIARFRQNLGQSEDESRRALLERLLVEAEQELAARQSIWLWTSPGIRIDPLAGALVETILDSAVERCGASFGTVQVWDEDAQCLRLIAQHDFDRPFVEHFACVREGDGSVCGAAIASQAPVLIADVDADPRFSSLRGIVGAFGVRAIHTTPVVTRDGRLAGMITTHFKSPRRTSDYPDLATANAVGELGRLFEGGFL